MFLFNVSIRRSLPVTCALLLSAASTGFAASSYSETYEDRLVNCTEVQTGKWTLKLTSPLSGDPNAFDAFTNVTITVGDVSFTKQLGSDCKYRAGTTHARLQNVVGLPGQLAADAQLSWGNGQLTALIRGFSPVSGSPIGDTLYAGAPGAVNGILSASVSFSNGSSATSNTPVTGIVTEKIKSSCNSQFNLRKVKLSGSGQ